MFKCHCVSQCSTHYKSTDLKAWIKIISFHIISSKLTVILSMIERCKITPINIYHTVNKFWSPCYHFFLKSACHKNHWSIHHHRILFCFDQLFSLSPLLPLHLNMLMAQGDPYQAASHWTGLEEKPATKMTGLVKTMIPCNIG